MTDRRQEAIKELRQIRQDMDKRHVPWKIGYWPEYVYDRLAALREFPEELEDMLGELYDATLDDYATRQWVKHWINKFKRLWQGQETLMEPEPLIDHRPFKGVKGGCPECGGSKKVLNRCCPICEEPGVGKPLGCIKHGFFDGLLVDCPACTGERRKGQQRKDTGKRDYDRANHTKDIDGCAPQYETLKGKTLDRRLSEERRKTSGDVSRPTEEAK